MQTSLKKEKKGESLSSELKAQWEAQTHLNFTVFSGASCTPLISPVLHKCYVSLALM